MESNDLSALEGRVYYDDFGASHHSSGDCLDGLNSPSFLSPSLPSKPGKAMDFLSMFREKEKTKPESKRMMREEKMRERIPVD